MRRLLIKMYAACVCERLGCARRSPQRRAFRVLALTLRIYNIVKVMSCDDGVIDRINCFKYNETIYARRVK